MNRKIIFIITGVSLLACNYLFPSPATPVPIQELEPTATGQPAVESPTEVVSDPNALPAIPEEGFVLIRFHSADGDLHAILAQESQKASALGLIPIVYFGATWCPPCQAIESALEEKNELMLDAYFGTYIIELDVDEWGWSGTAIEDFEFEFIPVYFKLDANGNQTGEVIDGGAWGQDIPENIAPVMDAFFHNK
ncbi:MAG: thioredoxin family protein [Anaerolineae bacterium]|nr:thioredoxin family protein [Anaerolineae bacterium]